MTGHQGPKPTARNTPAPPAATRTSARRRIRRQLKLLPEPVSRNEPHAPANLMVTFNSTSDDPAKSYDFSKLELPADVAALLADASQHHLAHLAPETRKAYWSSLCRFSRFARQTRPPLSSVESIDTQLIFRYRDWLYAQTSKKSGDPLAQKTVCIALTVLRNLLRTARDLPGIRLPHEIAFPAHLVPNRVAPPPVQHLNENQLKTILDQCYVEIAETMSRFKLGQELLSCPSPAPEHDPVLHQLVHAIADLTTSGFASHEALCSQGYTLRSISKYGGIDSLRSYVAATPNALTPFFLALQIQLAANPEALRKIRRACVRDHPLEDNLRVVFWKKPRAGRRRKRLQQRSFDIRKKHAAPNLIAAVQELTLPLVTRLESTNDVPLFLAPNSRKMHYGILTQRSLTFSVSTFRDRANLRVEQWNLDNPRRRRDPIPPFNLRQLRPSVAAIHYQATGADIRHTANILNHSNPTTTIRYVDSPRTQRLLEQIMARIANDFVCHINSASTLPLPGKHYPEPAPTPASASIGHLCLDPFRPPRTICTDTQPQLCPHFHSCLSCPGLVVPLDAAHLAQLLLFRDTLDTARDRLDPARWHNLYEPLSFSVDDILSRFPDSLLPEARELSLTLPPFPDLE